MSKDNPNFTIIAPGGCNSKCDFCTDPYNGQWNRDFMKLLHRSLILTKPENFTQCSISGGEPTLSPVFEQILWAARQNFAKTVLTSNGARIMHFKKVIAETVNHLNISRHAIGYDANVEIFKTKKIINDESLIELCRFMNSQGVDVNLNHVYTKGSTYTKEYVYDYVAYAKRMGANSVSFRYDQGENTLDETYLEAYFADHKVVNRGGCPVCRNHTVLIDGMQVVFKASFEEPSNTIGDVYELIFHTDGRLCTDWGGKNEFTQQMAGKYGLENNTLKRSSFDTLVGRASPRLVPIMPSVQPNYTGGGCGSNGGYAGGGCGGGGCGSLGYFG